jgi:TonB family protein
MKRRDPIILFALLAALGAHLALLGFGVYTARRDLGWWLQGPQAQAEAVPVTPPRDDPTQRLGEHTNRGESINSAPGPQPMESALSDARQEQAAMQRDPAGFGGKGSNRDLEQTLRGNNGDAAPQGTKTNAKTAAAVFGSRESTLAQATPKVTKSPPTGSVAKSNSTGTDNVFDPLSSGPLPIQPPKQVSKSDAPSTGTPDSAEPTNQQKGSEQAAANSGAGGKGGKPGAPDPGSGNPVPTSDFESYPVSHIASRFIGGRIEARIGRKMRARQLPRLGPAAIADLQSMDDPYVVLLLKIDESGNVTNVQISHSAGTDDIDLPCQRAAYTWWFEPMKDPKTGTIHGEIIEFTIYF